MNSIRFSRIVPVVALAVAGGLGVAEAQSDKNKDQSAPSQGSSARQDAQKQGMQQQGGQDKQGPAKQTKQAGAQGADVAVMLVPIAVATVDTMNNGCWARFYANQNFRGDVLAVSGPVSLGDMGRAQPFWGEADSAVIGPKARVTIYDNDNFRDQTAVLKPDQRIANLRDKKQVEWYEGVESMRVECTS
jgi:hypothetical protein